MFRDFLNAVRFLTVFPLPSAKDPKPDDLARSMFYFPAAGLLIAALSYGLFILAERFFPHRAAVLVLLIAPFLMSGGLHADGFADFCDGFFGGKDKENTLRIMKDPRVGAWGALGMALLVLVKYELLCVISLRASIFFLALAAARWTQVVLSAWLPYAGAGGGVSELVAGKAGIREVAGAGAFMLLPVIWMPAKGLLLLIFLIPVIFLIGIFYKQKIGGVTGDLLGAASEMTEIFVLAVWIMISRGLA